MIWTNFSLHYLWMLPSNFDVFCQMMFKNIFHYLLICKKKWPSFWPHITRWCSAQATAFLTKWFLRRSFYKTNLYFYLKTHASLRPYPWELYFVQTCICTICECFIHIFFLNLNKIILIISPSMWAWPFILTYIPFTYRDVMPSWITIGWWFRRRS